MKKIVFILGLVILISGCGKEMAITNFQECADAGYPILEIYPRQCQTPDGKTFIEEVEQPLETCQDLCGDGICQEVVCQALGCPCSETPSSCPGDCNFTYDIQGCDGQTKEDDIILTPSEDSLAFNQILSTYCETEYHLVLEYILSGNIIEIREIRDSSPVTKCLCSLEINGEIKNLAPGEYQVKFIFENQYTEQTEVLEELFVIIE